MLDQTNISKLVPLLDEGKLVGAEKGITHIVLEKGVDALSIKQREVFMERVAAKYLEFRCQRCSEMLTIEQLFLPPSKLFCDYCMHMRIKEGIE